MPFLYTDDKGFYHVAIVRKHITYDLFITRNKHTAFEHIALATEILGN